MRTRTQIYLEPEQHRALLEEARARRVSLAALIREIVQEHLTPNKGPALSVPKDKYLTIVGIGASGLSDISIHHDWYLGRALHSEHPR